MLATNAVTAPLFIITEIQNKGLALQSTCAIKRGTLIHSEKPLLRLQTPSSKQYYKIYADFELFEGLDERTQHEIAQFTDVHSEDYTEMEVNNLPLTGDGNMMTETMTPQRLQGIYKTNAIPAGPGHYSVYKVISRCNHACLPNAQYSWDLEKKVEVLYAMRDIKADEEITVSYLDWHDLLLMKKRQTLLENGFKFRSQQLRSLLDSAVKMSNLDGVSALRNFSEAADLMWQHGFPGIESLSRTATELSILWGDERMAERWAKFCIDYTILTRGASLQASNIIKLSGQLPMLALHGNIRLTSSPPEIWKVL